ncbi:NADAR family protein [Flavitalea flava]
MKYSNAWLQEKCQTDEKMKFLFFWGHQPSADGSLSQSCFSQWWELSFEKDGQIYPTAEHWMMAGKARLFADEEILARILLAKTPGKAKELGRKVKNFDPMVWDNNKFKMVVEGNLCKFSSNPSMKQFLLKTGDRVLVEASPVDTVWGIGLAADNKKVSDPFQWRGENLLGYALMEVRDLLITKTGPDAN